MSLSSLTVDSLIKEMIQYIEEIEIFRKAPSPDFGWIKDKMEALKHLREQFADLAKDSKKLDHRMPEIDLALSLLQKLEPIEELDSELKNIIEGRYQAELFSFTYYALDGFLKSSNRYSVPERVKVLESVIRSMGSMGSMVVLKTPLLIMVGKDKEETVYIVYPIMNEPGLRCTAAIQENIMNPVVEVQINFFGTVDLAAEVTNMDDGGPGQETIKKYEKKLIEQVNSLIHQLSLEHPQKRVRLKIAGHSLGGTLAKSFAHTIQRAMAVNRHSPQEIVDNIEQKLEGRHLLTQEAQKDLENLKERLRDDTMLFKDNLALNKIERVTIYALGAPGVGVTTDKHATLLTHYYHQDFLRMYHHFHAEDIIPKFGECEFLSGRHGVPNIIVNKTIEYRVEISPQEVKQARSLPYPGVTKYVMAAHNKRIDNADQRVKSIVLDTKESTVLLNKLVFSRFRHVLLKVMLILAKFLATFELMVKIFPGLRIFPTHKVCQPILTSRKGNDSSMEQSAVLPSHLF